MRFEEKSLKTSFSLPEPFKVKHHDIYEERRSAVLAAGAKTNLTVNFLGAVAIIKDWESEALPDLTKTIAATGELHGDQMRIVSWVGQRVHLYITSLQTIPKVSLEQLVSALSPNEASKGK